MKITIDDSIAKQYCIDLERIFALLLVMHLTSDNIESLFKDLIIDEWLVQTDKGLKVSKEISDKIQSLLLDSDKSTPDKNACVMLITKLRAIFPTGMKSDRYPWKGNMPDLVKTMQKFYALYGEKWTEEQIVKATQAYVDSFNGDYTYMRILPYFILKNEKVPDENGKVRWKPSSPLADRLNNPDITETESLSTLDFI